MDYVFTQRNLYWLDNLLPESNIRKKEDQLRAIEFASQPSQVEIVIIIIIIIIININNIIIIVAIIIIVIINFYIYLNY